MKNFKRFAVACFIALMLLPIAGRSDAARVDELGSCHQTQTAHEYRCRHNHLRLWVKKADEGRPSRRIERQIVAQGLTDYPRLLCWSKTDGEYDGGEYIVDLRYGHLRTKRSQPGSWELEHYTKWVRKYAAAHMCQVYSDALIKPE